MTTRECSLTLLLERGARQEHESCTLLNLCFGGMRFRSRQLLREGEVCQFSLDLQTPTRDSVAVKARIRWVHSSDAPGYDLGAVFVSSSKGWLGPEDHDGERTRRTDEDSPNLN